MARRRRGVRGPGIGTLVSRAWRGDVDAEREVLKLYQEALERGDSVPRPILQYTLGKLERGVKRPAHRPASPGKAHRDHEIAAFVYLKERAGATRKSAVLDAVQHFALSKSTIEKAVHDIVGDELHDALPGAAFGDTKKALNDLFPAERAARRRRA